MTFALALAVLATLLPLSHQAADLYVPNHSFERPATEFVDLQINEWQTMPKPDWFDESQGSWSQLTGVFKNTAPGSPDHIDNLDLDQAIFLFAVPQAGLFRDLRSADDSPATSDAPFHARFEPGYAYELTASVLGGGGGMQPGATLQLGLYYRDEAGDRVMVGATNIAHDIALFPTNTHLVDVTLRTPTVTAGDPWAGRTLGISLLSTVDPTLVGGYWDIDNLRLSEVIEIPNASFESPATEFVDNRVSDWQKVPKPEWYDESGGFTWDQLSGVFKNTAPGSDEHIDNLDGDQAFYLFAVPSNGIFQQSAGASGAGGAPATAFQASFESGRSYELILGLVGGGGGMTNGASLELALYDSASPETPVAVATTNIVFEPDRFPSVNHLIEVALKAPGVRSTDPWAGHPIGLRMISTSDPALAGGYWDVDDVRLISRQEPHFLAPLLTERSIRLPIRSEPGERIEIQASTDVNAAAAGWTRVATVTNLTGTMVVSTPLPDAEPAFYRALKLP